MDQKQLYTAPEVEPLVIRFEGMICGSPKGSFNENADVEEGDSEVFW